MRWDAGWRGVVRKGRGGDSYSGALNLLTCLPVCLSAY